jgi:hypothetical protein
MSTNTYAINYGFSAKCIVILSTFIALGCSGSDSESTNVGNPDGSGGYTATTTFGGLGGATMIASGGQIASGTTGISSGGTTTSTGMSSGGVTTTTSVVATGGVATGGATAATGGKSTGGATSATGGATSATGGAATGGNTAKACVPAATGGPKAMNPGTACISCHSGANPSAGVAITLGGTIYSGVSSTTAVSGATVTITDSKKVVTTLVTGSTGNFYTNKSISFPAQVAVSKCPDTATMISTVSSGDCNSCHGSTNRIHLP